MIVVEASTLVVALLDDGEEGEQVRSRLADEHLIVPELIYVEVVSALRRAATAGVSARRCGQAIDDLLDLQVQAIGMQEVARRCWELRGNLTAYDAAYVAVAEAFDAVLVTTDARLSKAPKLPCRVEVLVTR